MAQEKLTGKPMIQMVLSKDAKGIIMSVSSDVTHGKKIETEKLSASVKEQMDAAGTELCFLHWLLKREVK